MSLQEALRQMRLELGITQTDLAKKLNKSFLTVNRWENGKGFPSRENAKNILEIAHMGDVSAECYNYLHEMLMPDTKRSKSAAAYGFPDIDREFLFQLADASTNSLYIIEAETYNLLYANRKAEQTAVRHLQACGEEVSDRRLFTQRDKRCFHYFGALSAPCAFCPLKEFENDKYTDKVITIPQTGKVFHIHAKRTKMKMRDVYIIYLTDITEKDAETHALYELTNEIPGGVGIYNVYRAKRIELVFMNKVLYKMIGAEHRETLLEGGSSDLCLIHPEEKPNLWAEIKTALSQKRNVDIVLRMRVADGAYRHVRLVGKLIKTDDEKSTFYCLFNEVERQETNQK